METKNDTEKTMVIKLTEDEVEALQEVFEYAVPSAWSDGFSHSPDGIYNAFSGTIIEEVMQDKLERVCHEMECSRDADITYELVGFHFKVSEKKYKEIMKSRRLRAVALEDK